MQPAVLLSLLWCVTATAAKQPTFFARRDYGAFLAPEPEPGGFVAVADVNGDKIPDVICVTTGSTYTLLGNGNGTFRTGASIQPYVDILLSAVPIDLNGDGKMDLVVSGGGRNYPNGIGMFFGNGDGSFQPPVFYPVDSGGYLALGDFNGDGIPDVVTTGASGIWLLTGKAGGVFNTAVLVTPLTNLHYYLAAADLNGDGRLDLAVATTTGFVVVFGNGNGTFQAPVTYTTTTSFAPQWIAAHDLNQDGHPDIAVNGSSNSVYIYLNNGRGRLSEPTKTPLFGLEFAIGDLNGDNIPDLVSSAGYVSLGLGNAKFAPPIYYPVENVLGARNVVPADLRKKGLTDLVFGDVPDTSVLLNLGNGTFEDGESISLPGGSNCGAAADFNGDGKPDVAVPTPDGITILFGTGRPSPAYTLGPSFAESGPGCPITGDLNGDGIPDLLLGANGLGGVGAYLGNGDGTFRLASVIPVGPAQNLVLADFNHDGKLDFAASSNQMALGNGDGTFQPPVPIINNPPPEGLSWIAAGDVNNDGWDDILVVDAEYAYGGLYVILNNQHGGFTLSNTITDTGAYSVMVADLNGDGNLDAVLQTSLYAYVYLGDGHGGFTLTQSDIGYPGPDTLPAQIGDVNGDGIPDLLLPADDSIGIALGKGDGTFLPQFAVGTAAAVGQVFMQNLHGQLPKAGLPDLVAPDGGAVTVLINLTK